MIRLRTFMRQARPVITAANRSVCSNRNARSKSWLQAASSHRVAARHYSSALAAEPFLNGTSSTYVEDMYEAWQQDPTSVHKVRALAVC